MKRLSLVACSALALALLSSLGAFAGTMDQPAAPAEPAPAVAAPAQAAAPLQVSPAETIIFASAADDAAYSACCAVANANCSVSCDVNVSSFSCTRVGARGCNAFCSCL